MQPLPSTRSLE